jgi:two-component system, chemotaxis family, protein-glutamate methylesterase/glutaminase
VAKGRVELEPDVVYIAEGGCDLLVSPEGHFAYSAPASSHFVPSANRLFHSFAAAFGPRGTAVVLSGMGEDGADGLVEVVRRGGTALCQLPETALVPSMPASALKRARGAVAVLPESLPQAVCSSLSAL